MDSESSIGFNFWPAFADLMLAIVLILLVLFFFVQIALKSSVDTTRIRERQQAVITAIASAFRTHADSVGADEYGISVGQLHRSDITVFNEVSQQRIRFGTQVLFPADNFRLSTEGRRILRAIGSAIQKQDSSVLEIQIQGHADPDRTLKFESNLHLAGYRAIEVFGFLRDSVGLDPTRQLMSATSFGQYKPVQRGDRGSAYSSARLWADNATKNLKEKNRRIDLLLFYRIR